MDKQTRPRSLLSAAALAKLKEAAQIIYRRGSLKPTELKRVDELFTALNTPKLSDSYALFLQNVSKEAGRQMALLCAVALGRTAVKGMRERVRVDLPFEIKDQKLSWKNHVLDEVLAKHNHPGSANESEHQSQPMLPVRASLLENTARNNEGAASTMDNDEVRVGLHAEHVRETLSGYACKLTIEDVRTIILSDQISGGVWLTYPYDSNVAPFVTLSITLECARPYLNIRPQLG